MGLVPRSDHDTKRVQAEKSSPIQDYLGMKTMASETPAEKPATSGLNEDLPETPATQAPKTFLSRMGDDPLPVVNPESLPSYRQKTNRMFSFKPKPTATAATGTT
jgi:hypothetical protein